MVKPNASSDSIINRVKRTWATTLPNIILPTYINMFDLVLMFTWTIPCHFFLEQQTPVLGKGVLKL
jgi:hypothetical protein